jgi:hypothetical protein
MAHSHSTHTTPDPTGITEPDAVNVRSIVGFGIGLTVVAVISHLAMLLMFRVMANQAVAAEPPRVYPIAVLDDQRVPPEPRLQTDPKQDLKDLRSAEDQVLAGYGWVDRNGHIVRIPVAEAMKLTLQRGLPARSAGATAGEPAASQATQGTKKE